MFRFPCLRIQLLCLEVVAGGLEELGFQWSSPKTVNPAALETQDCKSEGGAFTGVRRFRMVKSRLSFPRRVRILGSTFNKGGH